MRLGMFAFLIAAVVAWSVFVFFLSNQIIFAVCVILSFVAAGFINVWIFARTYYPYLPVPKKVKDLKGEAVIDIGPTLTFELMQIIGVAATKKTKKSLVAVVEQLIASSETDFVLKRLQLNKAKLNESIKETVLTKITWAQFTERAYDIAVKLKHEYIGPEHALGAILTHPGISTKIRAADLTEEDVLFAIWWQSEDGRVKKYNKRWWDEDSMLAFTGVGMSWASGFTPFVDQFSRIPGGNSWDDIIYGHEEKVSDLINTLARQRQSNVLLVGDPGVGRLGIIRRLSRRIRMSQAHNALNGQRVLYVNVGELVAQGSTGAGQMALVSKALNEMEQAGNVIVIIDGLSSVLGESGEQRVNLTDILMPFLSSANVRVVVMSSTDDYHLRMKSNEEIIQYFEVVQVPSLSDEATMKRVALTLSKVERDSGLFIPYKTVRTLVRDTTSILPHIPFPERAYDFLEEAIVLAQSERSKTLKTEHIQTLISRKIGINLGQLKSKERQQLLNLEEIMHRRLVNQSNAVKTLGHALIRARAEVRSKKRPIGTFLFLGPTGVGKTETAKTLAETYFGSEDHMVRLDMSEFQGADGVARLIGSINQPTGRLTSMIADHPFSVLLLDEFEKASSEVHQLFLQVLDEGHLTDAGGRKFSFRHTIIIATSNAGAELIRKSVKDGNVPEGFDEILKEHILSNNLLRPELLNRFDAVVTYSPLSVDHIRQIAVLMLKSLNKRLDAKHGVTVAITDDLISFLVTIGYDPEFGARPMTRAIQDTVEYDVAQRIVKGEIQPGQEITLDPRALKGLGKD
jgi:ATP-dependent Clp protease ATP-binding subunit ClpC